MRRWHPLALIPALTTILDLWPTARPAAAAARSEEVSLGHRIDKLAAGDGRLFALRAGELVTYDDSGQPIGRCARLARPTAAQHRPELGAPEADEVLRAAGLSDDDSTPEAEDALEDEGLGPRHPHPTTPDSGVEAHALAASSNDRRAWIATSAGVYRGGEMGCARVGLEGRDVLAVAIGEHWIAAASEGLLFRAKRDLGDRDDGPLIFTVAAGLSLPPRALAVGSDGGTIVGDDEGIVAVGLDGVAARVLDRPTDALAVCDGVAMALSSDGVYAWTPGSDPRRIGDRPPARVLTCGVAGKNGWVAAGVGAWTSSDGRAWLERSELLGRSLAGVAAVGERLWFADGDELVALDLAQPPRPNATERPERPGPPPLPKRWTSTPLPWPRVTLALGVEETEIRRVLEVMVLLTFPLGRTSGHGTGPALLADELVRRDEAMARQDLDLKRALGDDDELEARRDAVQQEREALR